MSASSKKKLRKEQNAVQLTEKQLKEQQEAKKLKVTTFTFAIIMVLVLAIALGTVAAQMFSRSGIRERNTLALTVNEHELNNAELNYFYIDGINRFYLNWYQQYGDYATLYLQMYGLDLSKPLNEQAFDTEGKKTWADHFVELAISDAHGIYAQYDQAQKAGFKLSEEDQAELDAIPADLKAAAKDNSFSSSNKYLQAYYGPGADEKTYLEYAAVTKLATAYANSYYESLSFGDSDFRDYEKEHGKEFNSYTYASYYFNGADFREGGTKNEDGTTTYTDEQIAAGLAAAKEAAESMLGNNLRVNLDQAIAELPINEGKENVASTYYEDQAYSSVIVTLQDWVTDANRKAGDMEVIPNTSTVTNEDGTTTSTTNGYYIVLFEKCNDNATKMGDVRHLLVSFEGGTKDDEGNTIYSDEEKKKALTEAENLLNEWKQGEATEDSFAALVTEHTDDTASALSGGLYGNIYTGCGLVEAFEEWVLDEKRTVGETGIVETPYGYHIMYYVADGELTYRDFMINSVLEDEAMNKWYDDMEATATVTEGDTKYLKRDITMNTGY